MTQEILTTPTDCIPLIDGDILPYELGYVAEYASDDGIMGWEQVKNMVDNRIEGIVAEVGATAPALLFLTGEGNFRDIIAEKKGYKAQRKDKPKPFHFENIRAYLVNRYNAITCHGFEADDAMAYLQRKNTIICSRDKDLRMVPGKHFSWECGKQGQIGPYESDLMGEFWTDKLPKELKGTGLRFFYAQCLMGDVVDNIPGCPGVGPKGAYQKLSECETEQQLFDAVISSYVSRVKDDDAVNLFFEQANLLWMTRESDEQGKPVLFEACKRTSELLSDSQEPCVELFRSYTQKG